MPGSHRRTNTRYRGRLADRMVSQFWENRGRSSQAQTSRCRATGLPQSVQGRPPAPPDRVRDARRSRRSRSSASSATEMPRSAGWIWNGRMWLPRCAWRGVNAKNSDGSNPATAAAERTRDAPPPIEVKPNPRFGEPRSGTRRCWKVTDRKHKNKRHDESLDDSWRDTEQAIERGGRPG